MPGLPNLPRITVLMFNAEEDLSGILFFVDDYVALPPNRCRPRLRPCRPLCRDGGRSGVVTFVGGPIAS